VTDAAGGTVVFCVAATVEVSVTGSAAKSDGGGVTTLVRERVSAGKTDDNQPEVISQTLANSARAISFV
jgi:hypothetical protein